MRRSLDRQTLGKLGETLACDELRRLGYAILAKRYRTRFGEIDIAAEDAGAVIFVEVKARGTARCGVAADAIPFRKQRRLGAIALHYLARAGRLSDPCRFDVVAIDRIGTDAAEIRIIRDAFRLHGT